MSELFCSCDRSAGCPGEDIPIAFLPTWHEFFGIGRAEINIDEIFDEIYWE